MYKNQLFFLFFFILFLYFLSMVASLKLKKLPVAWLSFLILVLPVKVIFQLSAQF